MINDCNPTSAMKTKLKGDPRTLYALDRILGVEKDNADRMAADGAGSDKKKEVEHDDAEAEAETMEEEKEEMPLVCDVCGKTPDVEVRNYQSHLKTNSCIDDFR